MPWIGARTRHNNEVVQVKVYGPYKDFMIQQDKLAGYLREVIESKNGQRSLVDHVGNEMTKALKFDHNAMWVEVEIHNTDDFSFSGKTYIIEE